MAKDLLTYIIKRHGYWVVLVGPKRKQVFKSKYKKDCTRYKDEIKLIKHLPLDWRYFLDPNQRKIPTDSRTWLASKSDVGLLHEESDIVPSHGFVVLGSRIIKE